ncbi:hypothetical protein BJY01DRAFT_216028 [Aspergillus pseudoustus]|uniref:Secreted protein n=1 Tax=Aspergillus pseudoustus TaxID=1810923 RepID=A0ABR4JSX4_9EURO
MQAPLAAMRFQHLLPLLWGKSSTTSLMRSVNAAPISRPPEQSYIKQGVSNRPAVETQHPELSLGVLSERRRVVKEERNEEEKEASPQPHVLSSSATPGSRRSHTAKVVKVVRHARREFQKISS